MEGKEEGLGMRVGGEGCRYRVRDGGVGGEGRYRGGGWREMMMV